MILNYKFSDGMRSGRLVKITHKGTVLKTIEGTLDLGSGDNLTWSFSVHNKDIGLELERAIGKKVTVNYVERFYKLWWETPYDVQSYKVEEDDSQWYAHFCKLVNIMRQDENVVALMREKLANADTVLLDRIRQCQNLK